jgi:predicted RNA-binding Zn ribbon-like protein
MADPGAEAVPGGISFEQLTCGVRRSHLDLKSSVKNFRPEWVPARPSTPYHREAMPELISPAPAPGEELSTALALVNTAVEPRGEPLDLLPDARSLAGWLQARGLIGRRAAQIPDEDLERMRQLRAAIRTAFTARAARRRPPRSAITTINDAAARASSTPRLRWPDGGPAETTVWSPEAPVVDVAFAAIAVNAIHTLLGERGNRLRLCEAHGCNRVFIQDHGRRRWCSRACGDRVRVARHYQKLNRPT